MVTPRPHRCGHYFTKIFKKPFDKTAFVNKWNKWKRIESQQINGSYKEEPNGKFRTEYYEAKMKNSMDELNSGIKRTEERISKLEGRITEITLTEFQIRSRLR